LYCRDRWRVRCPSAKAICVHGESRYPEAHLERGTTTFHLRSKFMRRVVSVIGLATLVVGVATFVSLTGSSTAEGPDVLRVSAIPDENPSELLRIYTPFAEYLQRELKVKVQFTPVVDYAATVEGLAAKKLDLVWYGGFTSVQAARRTNGTAKRLVLR